MFAMSLLAFSAALLSIGLALPIKDFQMIKLVTICLASSSVTGFPELKKQNKLILEQYREKVVCCGLEIRMTFAHRSTCCFCASVASVQARQFCVRR